MSSDGEDYAGGDTDYEDDEMDDALFDQPDAAIPARNPVAQPYAQAAYNPPAAAMGQNDMFQAARYLNPGAFQAGFGGHAFARPPASAFRRSYRAYSTAILEVGAGRSGGVRNNVMYGGKIIMPPSALDELTQLDIEFPVTFEITNPALPDLNTHVGVLEFIAEEGTVNLPQWIMDQLRLNEGDPIRIWGARFPKGEMVKIQAQSVDFLEVSDPKAVLEQALRNFSCLSAGDIIEIGYQSLTFRLLIMEITPPGQAISVLDTDLSVDFAAPLGYIEPEYKPRGAINGPSMKEKFVIDTSRKEEVEARGSGSSTPVGGAGPGKEGSWEAFKGTGASLGGKRVKGKGVKAKGIEAVDADSRLMRTDQNRIITGDMQVGGRQVPAALTLPFGNLFFGYDNLRPPPGSAAALALAATPTVVPFAGVGSGNTLSGRAARAAPAPVATPIAPAPAAAPVGSFGGKGQSMSGRKPIETITIDD